MEFSCDITMEMNYEDKKLPWELPVMLTCENKLDAEEGRESDSYVL
jgi:hypothetical protein